MWLNYTIIDAYCFEESLLLCYIYIQTMVNLGFAAIKQEKVNSRM